MRIIASKALSPSSFWKSRNGYRVWDNTWRALYSLGTFIYNGPESDDVSISSRLVLTGKIDGILDHTTVDTDWYKLSQRCGIEDIEPKKPKKSDVSINTKKAQSILMKMVQYRALKSPPEKEIDSAIFVTSKGNKLLISQGTRRLPYDPVFVQSNMGYSSKWGVGGDVMSYISLKYPGIAGMQVSKDGGLVSEYVAGRRDMEFDPKTNDTVVYTWIKSLVGESQTKRAKVLQINRASGNVLTFDENGNPVRERRPNKREGRLFLPG